MREDWRVLMSCVLTRLHRAQGETSDPADTAGPLVCLAARRVGSSPLSASPLKGPPAPQGCGEDEGA